MGNKYDCLKLKNQFCFPLYACSKEVVRGHKPFLDKLGLTYTQYITMMVMWEYEEISVKDIGSILFLDSGTLTPVLKKLEQKKYVERRRDEKDERMVKILLTDDGRDLKEKALQIPSKSVCCGCLTEEESEELYRLLHKLLTGFKR